MESNILEVLFSRLCAQGLIPVEIPKLIENVFDLICDGGDFTMASVNQELKRYGWREGVVDSTTLELLVSFLETGKSHNVERHSIH